MDVVLVAGGSHVGPLQQVTHTLPIVFVEVADAVGSGFVESLARPGGNATGFTHFEFDISGKWLELLKQIAPNMTRTAVLRDQRNPAGTAQFGAIQALARTVRMAEVRPVGLQDTSEIERGIIEFARKPNGGLIVTPNGLAILHVDRILKGAKLGELPVEQSTRLVLSVNLKTARSVGVTVPTSLLARADEVIE